MRIFTCQKPLPLKIWLFCLLSIGGLSGWAQQAPVIVCPASYAVSTDSNSCDAVINYTPPSALSGADSTVFSYTGSSQIFVVPSGVTQVTIKCWGAQGNSNALGVNGGLGGYSEGLLSVTPGETLTVYVGQGGSTSTAGGYNGGGTAGTVGCSQAFGGGGGGASDVRQGGTALTNRVIVAGGGGGAGGNRVGGCGRGTGGGGGGGYYGGGGGAAWPSNSTILPTGGSQTAGGTGGNSNYTGAANNDGGSGSLGTGGFGGNEIASNQAGSCGAQAGGSGGGNTGGNGLYSCSFTGQSGAGGSGYIGGVTSGTTTNGVRTGNGQVTILFPNAVTSTQIAGIAPGGNFPPGPTINTYVASNAFGNDTCSFTITVLDSVAPVLNCPATITVSADSGACSAVANYSAPVGTDNCAVGSTSQTAGPASGSTYSIGATLHTFSVTDSAGNTTTCSFDVIVVDNEAPDAGCPANPIVGTDPGLCSAVVSYSINATDNCSTPTSTQLSGPAIGDTLNAGVYTVVWAATDSAGNSDTCTFSLTVEDQEAPAYTGCPSDTTITIDSTQCGTGFQISWTPPTYTDNCGVDTVLASHVPGASFTAGIDTVVYQGIDGAGNIGQCAFVVNVLQPQLVLATNPSLYPNGFNISCNGGDNGDITASVAGGCVPYTYNWNTGATTASISGVSAGTYTVTITDGVGTQVVDTINMTEPAAPTVTVAGNTLTSSPGPSYQWYLGDSLLSGATNQTYTLSSPGYYSVVHTDSFGCSVRSDSVEITVGVQDPFNEGSLSVFPNPFENEIRVELTLKTPYIVTLDIVDLMGKIIFTQRSDRETTTFRQNLNLAELPAGVYYVRMRAGEAGWMSKVVKQ